MNKTTNQIKTAAIIAGTLFLSFLNLSPVKGQCITNPDNTYLSFGSGAGTQSVYFVYDYNYDCTPSITPSDPWISVSVYGNRIDISVQQNTGAARWGEVMIINSGGGGEVMWAPSYDSDGEAINANSSSPSFSITINQAAGCTLPGGPVWVSSPTSACTNTPVIYSIQPISGATSYSWTVSTGGTITSGQGTTSVSINFTSTGSRTVTVRGVNGCGQGSSLSRTVSVTSAPAMPGTISGSGTVCANGTYTYSVVAVSGATSYHWEVPAGAIINSGQGTRTVSVKFGQYGGNIRVSASNATCSSAYRSRYIAVDDGSSEWHEVTGGGLTCPSGPGVPIGLASSTFENMYDLYRDGSNYVTTEFGSGSAISFGTFTEAGSYTVRTTSQYGCLVEIPGVQITHKTQSVAATGINASPTGTVCAGTSVTLTLTGGSLGQGASWRWYSSNCGSGYLGTGTSITVTPGTTTTYYVRAEGECNTTTCIQRQIIVNQPVVISSHPTSQIIKEGSSVSFSIAASGTGLSYQWQSSTNNGVNWTNVSGAASSTYSFTVNSSHDGNMFKCLVLGSCGTSVSNTARLRTNKAPEPNSSMNYIHSIIYKVGLGSNVTRDSLLITQVIDQISYFDGLGRPSQTVAFRQSPTQQDIVVPVVYDALGRQDRQFLPYAGGNTGSFKPNAQAAQANFYLNSVSTEMIDNKPYSRTVFEASPLNRVFEQGAPGEVWQPVEGSSSGRTIKYKYRTNTTGNVKLWKVSGNNLQYGGNYSAGSLNVTEIRDENWEWISSNDSLLHTTWEFKDFQGRVVLKRTYVKTGSTVTPLETYFVHDDIGLLRYVLSPRGTEVFGTPAIGTSYLPTHSNITQFCYYYRYDKSRRIIEKQLPGDSAVYMVYDNRDRLVLVQDGVRRAASQWAFTKYDELNRPVATGIYLPSKTHQQALDAYKETHENATVNPSLATGYNLPDLLTGTPIATTRILSLTYYDNYDAVYGSNSIAGLKDLTYDAHTDRSFTTSYSPEVMGLMTATRVKILNNSEYSTSAKWVGTVSYYDDRYRVIQTRRHLFDNVSNGKETASTLYDFTGQVMATRQYQQFNTAYTTVHKEYDYDHAGRILAVRQKILEDNPAQWVQLTANQYDVLGQLNKKELHVTAGVGFQKTDYKYNIRGWLTGINDPHNQGSDFFAMKLLYNNPEELNDINARAQFNGNISGWIWNNPEAGLSAYSYSYDAINRLNASKFYAHTGGNWNATPSFEERNITYDRNGNIMNLQRTNEAGQILKTLAYTYTGNRINTVNGSITFTYDANGNTTRHGLDGFTVLYNQLNLPRQITKSTESIAYIYTAMGEKVAKRLKDNRFQYYAGGFEYNHDKKLKMMPTEEGYVDVATSGAVTYTYHYYLKDHLGNTRVVFTPADVANPVKQLTDYYPFGMAHQYNRPNNDNKYLYNQKELQDDVLSSTGLNWYDYSARMYDPQLGRWHVIDISSEKYFEWSNYQYVRNNPILRIDPNGKWDVSVHVYNNREKYGYGIAIVKDRHGNEVFRFMVRVEGTAGRDRLKTNSDTPLGVYDIPDNSPWLTGGSRESYGPNARLNMAPVSGEILESGRNQIRIHGGRQEVYNSKTKTWTALANPQLKKTHGCLRAYDTDMASFKQITDNLQANDPEETPGQVSINDDLKEVTGPGDNNFVEIKVTYQVPENELDYWRNIIRNWFNNYNNEH